MIDIKAAINDNDTRLSIVETVAGISSNYSGYGTPFSADGAPKNVVLLRQVSGDGSGIYFLRSRYANSVEQVSIQGVMTTRPFIANYVAVTFDTNGALTSASNYLEAPLTSNYVNYVVEQSIYDVSTAAKTITDDTRHDVWTSSGSDAVRTMNIAVSINGVPSQTEHYADVRTLLGPGTVDSMSFDDLLGFHRQSTSSLTYRIRAKGIGDVMWMRHGSPLTKIIYYRVDGATGGSLAGTPFDTGQVFDGVFF